MKKREVNSIFIVEDYKTGKKERVTISGDGQKAISYLRGLYPKFTKFVLEDFECEDELIPVTYPNFHYDRRN